MEKYEAKNMADDIEATIAFGSDKILEKLVSA